MPAHLGELKAGDTVRWGTDGTTKVLSNDGEKVTVENPDAGNVYGNRNRAARTITMKVNSKRMSALTGIPPAPKDARPAPQTRSTQLADGTKLNVQFHGERK